MAQLRNPLILATIGLYATASMFGFMTAIATGVTVTNFHGNCILYARINWVDARSFLADFGNGHACGYVTWFNTFVSFLWGGSMAAVFFYAAYMSKVSENWYIPVAAGNTFVAILSLVSACLLSTGFNNFCGEVMKGKDKGAPIESCADVGGMSWKNVFQDRDYNTQTFHGTLQFAQAMSWIGWLLWCGVAGVSILRYYQYWVQGDLAAAPTPNPTPGVPGAGTTVEVPPAAGEMQHPDGKF